jgi:beta-phosphoglucomutase-like phosphatase (HAD superfamily)
MQRHALLLDVDGVILKSRRLLYRVEKNAAVYVHKHTKSEGSLLLNKSLYVRYGHTLIGLDREFDIQKSLADFNQFVYDKTTLTHQAVHLNSHEFACATHGIQEVLESCKGAGIPVHLFSNAPLEWCLPVAQRLDISPYNVIACNSLSKLKPNKAVYRHVHRALRKKYRTDCLQVVFVDDSLKNLAPLADTLDWLPVHMTKRDDTDLSLAARVEDFCQLRDFLTASGILNEFKDKSTLYL